MLVLASAEAVAGITAGATIIAALIIAVITARTTNGRQERQLEHDRELADLADLRKLLDEAAVALNGARDARDELDVSLTEHGVALPDEPKRQFKECGQGLVVLSARLTVRLGEADPIATHFEAACEALLRTWRQVSYLDDDTAASLKEKRTTIRADREAFAASASGFMRAAVKRAGTVPTQGPNDQASPS
jgi:hypothetical protein